MIKCIAIDDEPLALQQIARFIGRIPELQLVDTCLTVSKAREILEKEDVDLIFLDIEMPGCNGMDFARSISKAPHPTLKGMGDLEGWGGSIIFTTAYPQYAVDGFRIDAVDYLLKPLSFEELQEAVEKVKRRMAPAPQGHTDSATQTIFVKTAGTVRQIPVQDIIYVQGLSAYVQICVKGDPKLITTHESLKRLESLLTTGGFLRIHKSYIINIRHLEGADATTAILNGKSLPIGQKYRAAFKELLKQKLI